MQNILIKSFILLLLTSNVLLAKVTLRSEANLSYYKNIDSFSSSFSYVPEMGEIAVIINENSDDTFINLLDNGYQANDLFFDQLQNMLMSHPYIKGVTLCCDPQKYEDVFTLAGIVSSKLKLAECDYFMMINSENNSLKCIVKRQSHH